MADWIVWFVMAGVMVICEIFTGTFYLLMIAVGLAAGGLAALTGAGNAVQLSIAAIVGMSATYALRRSKLGKRHPVDAARDPNVNLDIGQVLPIEHWSSIGGTDVARVSYRGALWDAELAHGATAQSGMFVIREIRGSRLIVSNVVSDNH
jgi:membrane protein implicated in regulation of membrane protease activity